METATRPARTGTAKIIFPLSAYEVNSRAQSKAEYRVQNLISLSGGFVN
jgi:hypothetical protein